jgi:hypothetical protein
MEDLHALGSRLIPAGREVSDWKTDLPPKIVLPIDELTYPVPGFAVQKGNSDASRLVATGISASHRGAVFFSSGWFDHPPRPEKISEKSVIPCLILEIRGTRITAFSGWFLFSRNQGVRIMFSTAFLLAASMVVGQAEEPIGPTADDYLAFVRAFFPGTWDYKVTTRAGSVVEQGVMEAQIGANQRCAVTIQTAEGQARKHTAIHGYDPGAKCWRVLQFSGDDSMLEMKVYISPETLKSRNFENLKYRHQTTLTTADGTRIENDWEATIIDRDTLELRRVSGDDEGPAIMRLVRKK